MYGPTVVIRTRVASATARKDPASVTSAWSSDRPAEPSPSRARTCSSLPRFRPASAQRVCAGAWAARYSAVSAPVKPVAPNTTTSYSRSATVAQLARYPERLGGVDTGARRQPAGHRRGHALGRVRGFRRHVQERLELLVRGSGGAEPLGVGGQPFAGIHGCGTLVTPGDWYICTTMVATASHGTRPRGAARRDALLDAVLRVVAQDGVDAVTHRRVAEVAGLPLASTPYSFDSKEHLLTAALERAAEHDIERLRSFLADAPDPAPLGLAVRAILGPVEEFAGAPPSGPAEHRTHTSSRGWLLATYALMLEAARRPALREVTTRWTDAYLEALAPLLAAAGSRHPRSDAELVVAAA